MKQSVKNLGQGVMCAVFLTQNMAPVFAQQAVGIGNGRDVVQGSLGDLACGTSVSATCTIQSLTKSIVSALLGSLSVVALGDQQGTALAGTGGSLIQAATGTTSTAYVAGTINPLRVSTGGVLMVGAGFDPCQMLKKTFTTISITTTSVQRILAQVNTTSNLYVCHMLIYPSTTASIILSTGSAGTCAVSSAALMGGLTATSGLQVAAQAGFVVGNGGFSVMQTYTAGFEICLQASVASTNGSSIAGNLSYVNF